MPGCRLRPKLPLAALVECLWYWQGAPGPHLQERLLPQRAYQQRLARGLLQAIEHYFARGA